MKRKVFIAGPFTGILNNKNKSGTSEIDSAYKRIFNDLIQFFSEKNFHVHNAHLREGWGLKLMPPHVCTKIDYEEIASSDYLIGFPGNPISPGTCVEIGWASALNKKIILFLEKNIVYPHLIVGLNSFADINFIEYEQFTDIIPQLSQLFSQNAIIA